MSSEKNSVNPAIRSMLNARKDFLEVEHDVAPFGFLCRINTRRIIGLPNRSRLLWRSSHELDEEDERASQETWFHDCCNTRYSVLRQLHIALRSGDIDVLVTLDYWICGALYFLRAVGTRQAILDQTILWNPFTVSRFTANHDTCRVCRRYHRLYIVSLFQFRELTFVGAHHLEGDWSVNLRMKV
jgi:hypothetical protein